MRRLPLAIVAGLLLQSGLAHAASKDLRDWYAACDNIRTCAALAVTDKSLGSYLRIDRDGAPNAAPRVTIVVAADKELAFDMAFDDPAIPGLPKGPFKVANDDTTKIEIAAGNVETMLAALRKAQKLTITYTDAANKKPDERTIAEISLSGAAAAMLWIDEQQKRLGTVTALARRGDKPASSVPAPPPLPVVRAPKAGNTAIPKTFPDTLMARAKEVCGEEEDKPKAGDINRLSGNLLLFWIGCPDLSGAYNFYSAPLMAAPNTLQSAKLVRFPPPPDVKPNQESAVLTNPHFDEKTMTVSEFSKGRGIGDCGSSTDWTWDGKAFRVTRHAIMPVCGAVMFDEWPPLYRATVKN